MENKDTTEKVQQIKDKMDSMLTADSQDELISIYTQIVGELGACYTELTSAMANNKIKDTEPPDETVQPEENIIATDMVETSEASEVHNETTEDILVQDTEDNTPAYAVFYSMNNAAYVAVDERMHVCMPVRNLAKAYCVAADANSIANGQNELSKYKLDKLKPLQIKFLTQKEYDETIGKAKQMRELLANMPEVTSVNHNTEHKVTNFASNSKTSSNHIGEKPSYSYDKSYKSSYGDGYNYYTSKPYDTLKTTNISHSSPQRFKISLTDAIENPRSLYQMMHDDVDDIADVTRPHSYENDLVSLSSKDYAEISDFDVLIPIINETLHAIEQTRAGWLTDLFIESGKCIDTDYMMDIDYALLDTAIEEWNEINRPSKIMYVEAFDPTIIDFKKNIEAAAGKYGFEKEELASMAIYNYVRCLLAYESFKARNGIVA